MAVWLRQVSVLIGEELRELGTLARFWLVVALFVALLASGWIGLLTLQQKVGGAGSLAVLMPQLRQNFDQFLSQNDLDSASVLFDFIYTAPPAVWMLQFFSLLSFPILATLVSYDMIARDSDRGTHRYLLQRTSRSAYLAGKLMSHLGLYLTLYLSSMIGMLLLCWAQVPGFAIGAAVQLVLQYLTGMVPFFCWIVASSALVSTVTRRPGVALLLINLLWILLLSFAGSPWSSPLAYESTFGLLVPHGEYLMYSVLFGCGWTVLFVVLTGTTFRMRQL